MDIRKIANFSQEDFAVLTTAGKMLGDLNKAINAGDINELDTESLDIVRALGVVTTDIVQNENLAKPVEL